MQIQTQRQTYLLKFISAQTQARVFAQAEADNGQGDYKAVYKLLQNIKNDTSIRAYLDFRDRDREEIKNNKRCYNLRNNVYGITSSLSALGAVNKKTSKESQFMSNLDWQQVAKWVEKFDQLSFLSHVFAEFGICCIEFALFKSEHFEILSSLSFYCDNISQKPDIYAFDELKDKINQYRVSSPVSKQQLQNHQESPQMNTLACGNNHWIDIYIYTKR